MVTIGRITILLGFTARSQLPHYLLEDGIGSFPGDKLHRWLQEGKVK